MAQELVGDDFNHADRCNEYLMGLTRRTHRRLMHHAAHPSAAKKFNPHQLKSARRLLRNILEHPDDIMGNIRQYVNY